jgi:hypothetical protein
MASVNHKALEYERLRKLVNESRAYAALKDLYKIAETNKLQPELEQIEQIRDNLQFLDSHLKANSIDPMFANAKRSGLMFDILDMIDDLEEKKSLKITFKARKDVNLILDPSIGLDDKKKHALVKMMEKILGVSGDNIGIEQAVSR